VPPLARSVVSIGSGTAPNCGPEQRVAQLQIGGVLWTCSISPLFAQKGVRGTVLPLGRCGNGHELTPDNLLLAERGTRSDSPGRRALSPGVSSRSMR
jgi:hypothetical protein